MLNNIVQEKQDWRQWNLRIPLILFIFGATAALYQSIPTLFLFHSNLLMSFQYIGGMVFLIWIFEKTGLNNRKIHIVFGILLILAGLTLDRILV